MPITDKLGFGISIALLSLYLIMCPVVNILGNGPVAQPINNGSPCSLIYFPDLKDVSKSVCVDACPVEGDKKLECSNCNGAVYDTAEYNQACLPTSFQSLKTVMPQVATTSISRLSVSLKQNYVYVIFGLFLVTSLLYFTQYYIRTYWQLIISFLIYYYPYGVLWLAIVLANRVSAFTEIGKLERVGSARKLNGQSIGLLVEAQNYETADVIMLALLIKVFIGTVITQLYYKSDIEDYRLKGYIALKLKNNLHSYQKYSVVLKILVIINFFILYCSLVAASSIGAYDKSQPAFSQYTPSIVGIILGTLMILLFLFTSRLLRLYNDYFIYIFSLENLMEWKDNEHALKNSLNAFGTISLLALKQMLNTPKQLGVKFLRLINKPHLAAKWVNDLQLITSLTIGRHVYTVTQNQINKQNLAEPDLQNCIDTLQIKDLDVVYRLCMIFIIVDTQGETILQYSGWSLGSLIGLINMLFGCGLPTVVVMVALCCDLNYMFSGQFIKGFLAIGLIEGDHADKMMNYYNTIITIEKEEMKNN